MKNTKKKVRKEQNKWKNKKSITDENLENMSHYGSKNRIYTKKVKN